MSASVLVDKGGSFRVEWSEADGYTRERRFGSFRAAERFARQVDCRLQMEAMADVGSTHPTHSFRGK
jgi:hypothetical protein